MGSDPNAVLYGFLGLIVGLYIGSALANLLHELGHALAILALTDRKATVRIGRGSARVRFKFGRLSVFWDPVGAWRSDKADKAQVAFVGGGLPPGRQAIIFAAGPITALILCAASAAGALLVGTEQPFVFAVLAVSAVFALESGLLNLLPFRLGGQKTDGRKIIDAFHRAPPDEQVRQQIWLYFNTGVEQIDERARVVGMSREAWLSERFSEAVVPELREMARTVELGEREPLPAEQSQRSDRYAVVVGANNEVDEDGWQYRLSVVLMLAHSDVLLMGTAAKQAGISAADWIAGEFGRRVVEPLLVPADSAGQ